MAGEIHTDRAPLGGKSASWVLLLSALLLAGGGGWLWSESRPRRCHSAVRDLTDVRRIFAEAALLADRVMSMRREILDVYQIEGEIPALPARVEECYWSRRGDLSMGATSAAEAERVARQMAAFVACFEPLTCQPVDLHEEWLPPPMPEPGSVVPGEDLVWTTRAGERFIQNMLCAASAAESVFAHVGEQCLGVVMEGGDSTPEWR